MFIFDSTYTNTYLQYIPCTLTHHTLHTSYIYDDYNKLHRGGTGQKYHNIHNMCPNIFKYNVYKYNNISI